MSICDDIIHRKHRGMSQELISSMICRMIGKRLIRGIMEMSNAKRG